MSRTEDVRHRIDALPIAGGTVVTSPRSPGLVPMSSLEPLLGDFRRALDVIDAARAVIESLDPDDDGAWDTLDTALMRWERGS